MLFDERIDLLISDFQLLLPFDGQRGKLCENLLVSDGGFGERFGDFLDDS